jgi:hypothetical protein
VHASDGKRLRCHIIFVSVDRLLRFHQWPFVLFRI